MNQIQIIAVWFQNWTTSEIQGYAALISASFALLYGSWRYVVKPTISLIKRINQTSSTISTSMPILIDIAKEFRPNGGNSLHDRLNRIEINIILISKKQKYIVDILEIALFESDKKGNCIWVSQKLIDYFGLEREEFVGDGWLTAVHPDDREKSTKDWFNAIKHEKEIFSEYRIINAKTGITTLFKWHAMPIKSNGEIIGYSGYVYL